MVHNVPYQYIKKKKEMLPKVHTETTTLHTGHNIWIFHANCCLCLFAQTFFTSNPNENKNLSNHSDKLRSSENEIFPSIDNLYTRTHLKDKAYISVQVLIKKCVQASIQFVTHVTGNLLLFPLCGCFNTSRLIFSYTFAHPNPKVYCVWYL